MIRAGCRAAFVALLVGLSASASGQQAALPKPLARFAAGVDISELGTLEQHGAVYRLHGRAENPYKILHRAGINWVRVRLFVHPSGAGPLTNDLAYALAEARAAHRRHLHVLLDMHFSDTWADPSKQGIPAAWEGLNHEQLVRQVHAYAAETLRSFARAGAAPEMVEVGNEITNGMLWPDGRLTGNHSDDAEWDRLAELLRAAESGVVEGAGSKHRPLIMIHLDRGGDADASRAYFDHILARGVRVDVIGLSDYPWWQGSLEQLAGNLTSLAERFHKPIIVVETGFPWSPQSFTVDEKTYTGAAAEAEVLHFPATPEGQAEYLRHLIATVRAAPDGLGVGVFYWAGMWIDNARWGAPEWSGDWVHRALFGPDGHALPGLFALGAAGRLPTQAP